MSRPDPRRNPKNNKTNRHRRPVQNHRRPTNYTPPRSSASYYTQDSTARQVHIEEEQHHMPTPAPRRKTVRVAKKAEIMYDVQARHRKHLLSHLILVAFFGGLLGVLALQINLQHSRTQLEQANAQLAALQNNNMIREAEIHASLDLDAIRAIAIYELGMIQPEDWQMITLHAPRETVTIAVDEPTITQNTFSFANIRNIFSAFSGRGD